MGGTIHVRPQARSCVVRGWRGRDGLSVLRRDDPHEVDVSDIIGIYYDLDHPIHEQDFDAREAARSFEGVVQSINSGVAFRVY
jgi:hypothetical protein